MVLHNVYINGNPAAFDIHIEDDTISGINAARTTAGAICFEHAIAFPGLINSHDHLDFNSFPRLGNHTYEDYVAWGNDIHAVNKDIISNVLQIPKQLRVMWSLYKNLLNGVTTVVQHGEHFTTDNELVRVFQNCVSIHSIQLGKNWKLRLNKPRFNNEPVVIHIGEGTNAGAAAEINELLRRNLLRKKLIGIHGVAMNTDQAKKFHALVWSPDTNYFLLGKTAEIDRLKNVVPILFGTDSTLTGHWSIWEQLRIALKTGMVTQQELFDMLTATPARIWNMQDSGTLETGKTADIVVAKAKEEQSYLNSFFSLKPEDILLVMHDGNIRLFDETLYPQFLDKDLQLQYFTRISVNGVIKYVFGNLPKLMEDIHQYAPDIVFPVAGIT